MGILTQFYDWSEVWALLIPLATWLRYRNQPATMQPVLWYLIVALLVNTVGDVIGDHRHHLPAWLSSNTPLYDFHSLVRFACFWVFFWRLRTPLFSKILAALGALFVVAVLVNGIFVEAIFSQSRISGNTLTVEAFLLLACCLLYYFNLIHQSTDNHLLRKDFWVTTGLSLYVVVNFFVFLFYEPMLLDNPRVADAMWDVHNLAYIIFCCFIAKGLHVSHRH
jgi:hypothetical protein